MTSRNVFVPLGDGAPPPNIKEEPDHPVPRLGIVNQNLPIQTNKFYANFFLGGRTCATWTHPYSVAWVNGLGSTGSWGISVSHIDRNQLALGPGDPVQYFINPIGIQSMILSAHELGNGTALTLDSTMPFSIDVNLAPSAEQTPMMTFPLVQGMGFVTAVYNHGTPLLQTGVFFNNIEFGGTISDSTVRYTVSLNDGRIWLIYITPAAGYTAPVLTLENNAMILGSHAFSGSVQVAKIPDANSINMSIYDACAGVYPLRGAVSASAEQNIGTYHFSWTKGGMINRPLLMFALPHHAQSFPSEFFRQHARPGLQLQTTTKGSAIAVVADNWTMVERNLPFDMHFAPWDPQYRSRTRIPPDAMALINEAATMELNQDMNAQTNLNSMYFAGKGLAKFAFTIYAVGVMGNNIALAKSGLAKLKECFARFVNNEQVFPLVYEDGWGGLVSSGSFKTGDAGVDFGNSYYNDHHFHYGYFVYTASVITYFDQNWLTEGTNKAWVTALLRDYANPSTTDGYFPFCRNFDWYHGHSWAHGLYESADGKDQESSSEDAFATYAMKMWGWVTGDADTEARGNLMLAIQARSLNNYFLMAANNQVQPPQFIGNKVAGILFENKIDHTTYFGANISYIQGIHMIPLNPSSMLTRPRTFVAEEWSTYFDNDRIDNVAEGGWKGLVYANLAIVDPKRAWRFFADEGFREEWLDGGASRSWYLAWCAGLGGAD